MNLKIVEAKQNDKDFILHANHEIDVVSSIETSKLKENIDEDLLFDCQPKDKKMICLIAKSEDEYAGMVLFSRVYWADRGEGIYVSQAYVIPKFRGCGVFKKMLRSAFNFFDDTKFVTLLVAKNNEVMKKCVKNFEKEDMLSFVINKEDFLKKLN